jgi:Xaa-Pro aminopeptidase
MESQRAAYSDVQAKAKRVLSLLGPTISHEDTERPIAARATEFLKQQGLHETWYYQCPAMVLLGSRSAISLSGRVYEPSDEAVGALNLVTVDLSPCQGSLWGDCARTYAVENGHFADRPTEADFRAGFEVERSLHELLISSVTRETTFSELHSLASTYLEKWKYDNLDNNHNFGHSIETRPDDRIYVAAGNARDLGSVDYFTFEPHIRKRGTGWGFKHEDIYYFGSRGKACVL